MLSRNVILTVGLILVAGPLSAGEPGGAGLSFAEKLFAERDFYRAITEYKRFLFEHSDDARAPWVEFRIGESYLAGDRPDSAVSVFEGLLSNSGDPRLRQLAILAIARAYYQQGRLEQSLRLIGPLVPELADPELSGYGGYLRGCLLLKTGRLEASQEAFRSLWAGHRLGPRALWLAEKVPRAAELPSKSPVLAGLLSLVPGLGHVYLEEYAIAITALAWNGLFGYATWDTFHKGHYGVGALLAGLTLLWYSGTIYGAVSGAHRYNRDARLNYYDYLDAGAGLDPVFPDPKMVGGILLGGTLP